MVLMTDFCYFLNTFILLKVIEGPGYEIVGIDARLLAKAEALRIYDWWLSLLLVEAALIYFFKLLFLKIIKLCGRVVGFNIHIYRTIMVVGYTRSIN